MLTPILATNDPYAAAEDLRRAGWTIEFGTPPEGGDPLACVSLAGARVLLGTSLPRFLAPEARPYRGAGVEFYVDVPEGDLDAIHARHRAGNPSTTSLGERPFGARAFQVRLAGFRFMISSSTSPG